MGNTAPMVGVYLIRYRWPVAHPAGCIPVYMSHSPQWGWMYLRRRAGTVDGNVLLILGLDTVKLCHNGAGRCVFRDGQRETASGTARVERKNWIRQHDHRGRLARKGRGAPDGAAAHLPTEVACLSRAPPDPPAGPTPGPTPPGIWRISSGSSGLRGPRPYRTGGAPAPTRCRATTGRTVAAT